MEMIENSPTGAGSGAQKLHGAMALRLMRYLSPIEDNVHETVRWLRPKPRKSNGRKWSAGKLPESVLTRYDLPGTYIRGRLQYAY